jgi:SPP1 gp7 family putative phage head morphogenesis protein
MVVKANTGYDLPPVMQGAPRATELGVSVFRSEPFLKPLADGWVSENTSLIKSIPTKLNPEIEGIVRRGVTSGASVTDIAKQIKDRYGVTDNRARLIAQDQTLKLNADLTRHRLQSVGVERYVWRTVNDNRVRHNHVERNGKTFAWDTPPSGGSHPGIEVRCRCRSEAIWDDEAEVAPSPPPKPLANEVDFSSTAFSGITAQEVSRKFATLPADQLALVQKLGKPRSIQSKVNSGVFTRNAQSIVADTDAENGLVLFHEYGHHVDFQLGENRQAWSFTDEGFQQAYAADRKLLGLAGNKRAEKLKGLKEELYDDVIKTRTLRGNTLIYAAIQLKIPALSGVSDTVDALSSGAFQNAHGAFGHGKSYFKRVEARYLEAFANLFQLRANREHWEYAKTKFPNMTKRLEEVIRDNLK